jgi:hypothetical protein
MNPKDREDELAAKEKELSKEWAQSMHIIKRLAAAKAIEELEEQKRFVNHNNDSYLRGVVKRLASQQKSKG